MIVGGSYVLPSARRRSSRLAVASIRGPIDQLASTDLKPNSVLISARRAFICCATCSLVRFKYRSIAQSSPL